MTDRKPYRFHSLNLKIVLVTLLALIIGVLSFYVTFKVSTYLVDSLYMSDTAVSARKAKIYTEFNRYVNANMVSGRDSQTIAMWSQDHPYVSIIVFSAPGADSGIRNGMVPDAVGIRNAAQYNGQYGKLYPMKFADGTYQIAISDSSRDYEVSINIIICLAISIVVFISIVLIYTMTLTNRIIDLSKQAYYISTGDLDAPLSSGHGDEISVLADHVDNLRNSVVEKMTNEHEAWQANSDLITAISHDIRTPMTSLIGYLDLLSETGFSDSEKCAVFTRSALNKATELKNLTDELFRYFLVFGNTDPKLENDTFDGVMLFGQLLGDAEFELADNGFHTEIRYPEAECKIYVDPMYVKRVIDNIVSNIRKYADPQFPLEFSIEIREKNLYISCSNAIRTSSPAVESNKIGLKTCVRIMELLEGSFTTRSYRGRFTATLTLPIRS